MKRLELVAKLERAGCRLLRHNSRHHIDFNPETGKSQPIPRHREINEILAKKILKDLTRLPERPDAILVVLDFVHQNLWIF